MEDRILLLMEKELARLEYYSNRQEWSNFKNENDCREALLSYAMLLNKLKEYEFKKDINKE